MNPVPFEQVEKCLPPPSRGPLVLIPQPLVGSSIFPQDQNGKRLPTITFQSKRFNAELGIKVGEVLADKLSCAPHDLVGVMDQVFSGTAGVINLSIPVSRGLFFWLRCKLTPCMPLVAWLSGLFEIAGHPTKYHHPRLRPHDDFTRNYGARADFAGDKHPSGIHLNLALRFGPQNTEIMRGMEHWQIGDGAIRPRDLIITSLVHRGGPHWQPILFTPSKVFTPPGAQRPLKA